MLFRSVTVQLLILCGLGLPIGLVFGMLSAKGILIAATRWLNPKLFLADSAQALDASIAGSDADILLLLVSVLATLLFTILASFPSARYAAQISPTEAMRGRSTKIRRRSRKGFVVLRHFMHA